MVYSSAVSRFSSLPFLFATSFLKHSHTSATALDADGGKEETFGAEREREKEQKAKWLTEHYTHSP